MRGPELAAKILRFTLELGKSSVDNCQNDDHKGITTIEGSGLYALAFMFSFERV